MKWSCIAQGQSTSAAARCNVCGWKMKARDLEARDVLTAVHRHVAETGHTVVRVYSSKTLYSPGGQTVEEPAPKRAMWCRDCNKEVGIGAKNRVLFWAAKSHFRKTGHHIDLVEPDGTRQPYT